MTNEEWEQLRNKIEGMLVERVNSFILVAEGEDENGNSFTFNAMSGSNATTIGLAHMLIHDIQHARDKAYEEEQE